MPGRPDLFPLGPLWHGTTISMTIMAIQVWLFAELSQSPVQNPALPPGQPGQPKIQVKGWALADDHDYSWPGPAGAAGAPELLERNAMMYLCLKL